MQKSRPRTPDFNFATMPPVGLVIEVRGLPYEVVAHEHLTRWDGERVTIGRWRGRCLCGEHFEFLSASRADYARRNCDKHKGHKRGDFENASSGVAHILQSVTVASDTQSQVPAAIQAKGTGRPRGRPPKRPEQADEKIYCMTLRLPASLRRDLRCAADDLTDKTRSIVTVHDLILESLHTRLQKPA